jgi:hypothetical protein
LTWYLKDLKLLGTAYSLNIPIKAGRLSSDTSKIEPYQEFGLRLDKDDLQYSRLPGIVYDLGGDLGFSLQLDDLPRTITFDVIEKRHGTWTAGVTVLL